jgi:hypothetical protein
MSIDAPMGAHSGEDGFRSSGRPAMQNLVLTRHRFSSPCVVDGGGKQLSSRDDSPAPLESIWLIAH